VDALDRARIQVDQADPGVIPGALGGLVRADRRDFAAGPAELEDVRVLGRDVAGLAGHRVDEPKPPPELRGPEDLWILRLRALLLDPGRRFCASPVGSDFGREHEQPGPVGRPVNVLDRAWNLAELRVVDPEREAPLVAAPGRVGKPRALRREARE